MNKKKENTIWIIFCCLVFAGLFIFFVFYRPVPLFDTDDWTYLNFTRNRNLLPGKDEWNPTRILPENLFPVTGYIGKFLLMPITGDFFTSIMLSCSIMLCIFVFSYIILMIRAVATKFSLTLSDKIILTLFLTVLCFISHLSKGEHYNFLFFGGNATNVFYYIIPNLFNMILVCLSMIHEDQLRHMFKKDHWICKIIYMIMIYFAIFSNLYTSIVFAAYSAVKTLQYIFIEARDYTTDRIDKLIQSIVYIYALLLWFISMIFEVSGGRATQVSSYTTFDLGASFKALFTAMFKTNILFQLILICSIITFIIALVDVIRNRSRYLAPLMKQLKRTSKNPSNRNKSDSNTATDESLPLDKDRFTLANYATLMLLCTILTIAFLILLGAKTGTIYFSNPGVQSDYFSFVILITIMTLALLLKCKHKSIFVILACTIIMECLIVFSPGSYSYYRYPPEKCKAITDYIIEQYVVADKSNKKAEVHVPVFPTDDNSPIAITYGNGRIAMTLANYGITNGYIESELIPDQAINDKFGF